MFHFLQATGTDGELENSCSSIRPHHHHQEGSWKDNGQEPLISWPGMANRMDQGVEQSPVMAVSSLIPFRFDFCVPGDFSVPPSLPNFEIAFSFLIRVLDLKFKQLHFAANWGKSTQH